MLNSTHDKITSKGWDLYRSNGEGPVKNLEVGAEYIVLPQITDPSKMEKLIAAAEYMKQKQIFPIFLHNDDPYLIGHLSINLNHVLVSSPAGEI